jgi:hypothetical protein
MKNLADLHVMREEIVTSSLYIRNDQIESADGAGRG